MTLVLIAVLAAAPAVWSQSQAAPPVPAEVPGVAGEGLHLYPLGWSSEGRWGALIGSAGTLRVVVIDAVTDEVLHESKSFPWAGPDAAAQFWRAESAAVMGIMKTFNLESSRQADVRDAEFITGGVRYTFALEPKSPADGTYTLKISSSRGDSKTVYRSPPASPPHRAWLLGVLVSPFEERALAILREWPSSKDKPRYRFSGAHLTQGFSHPRNNAAQPQEFPEAVYSPQCSTVRNTW